MLSSTKRVAVNAGSGAVVPLTAAQGAPQSVPSDAEIESDFTATWKTIPLDVIPPGSNCATSIESSLTGTCHVVSQMGAEVGMSQAPRAATAAIAASAIVLRGEVMRCSNSKGDARGGNRTRTRGEPRGILSPLRLPVPPPGPQGKVMPWQ